MEAVQLLLPFIVGGLIWPLVEYLKKWNIPVRPEFVAFTIAALITWGLTAWFDPAQCGAVQIITLAMGAVGTSAVLNGGKKQLVAKSVNDHSS